ncbi:MAG: CoA transferase, partial [Gammaproteobacteria bacterium]|nr:CoA transferase [Gammaproteobacteria bacterium]
GVAISDTSAGMFLGQGILLALLHRERTGEGQWVHTSLLESMMCKLDFQGARYTMNGDVADQQGNDHPTHASMGTYQAADGYVNIAAFGEVMWKRFCDALGAIALLEDCRYQSVPDRVAQKKHLKNDMNVVTKQFSVEQLVQRLNTAGVPCGSINTIGEGFEDPQVKFLGMAKAAPHAHLGDVDLVRTPINLSSFPHPAKFDCAAPDTGQHTRDILRSLDVSAEDMDTLFDAGVIAE